MLKTFIILCLLGSYTNLLGRQGFNALPKNDSLIKSYLETGKIAEVEKLLSGEWVGWEHMLPPAPYTTKDTFLLAEFAYFTCKFEQALELYKKIPPTRLECNNALERIILLQECPASDLQNYVKAELLGRQGKWKQTFDLLNKLKQSNSEPIASYSSILLIQFLDTTGQHPATGRSGPLTRQLENSIKACLEFIMKYPENPKIPEVLLKEAEIYAKLGKQAEAKKIYKEILLKYPKSAVASIARLRLE